MSSEEVDVFEAGPYVVLPHSMVREIANREIAKSRLAIHQTAARDELLAAFHPSMASAHRTLSQDSS
jgi:hypothetical protein